MRRGLGTSGTTVNIPQPNHRGARRRRGRGVLKLIGKHKEVKLPQSGKGNRLPGSPGS